MMGESAAALTTSAAKDTGRSLAEIVLALTDDERDVLRSTMRSALRRIEDQRGGEYTRSTYNRKAEAAEQLAMELLGVEIKRAIGLVARSRRPPSPPLDAITRYESALAYFQQAVWRMRIAADTPPPKKPVAIVQYESACAALVKEIRARASKKGSYWLRSEMLRRLEDHIVDVLGKRAQRVQQRRDPRRSQTVPRLSPLAGDHPDADADDERHRESFLHHEKRHAGVSIGPEQFLSKADVRRLLPQLDLKFLDELKVDGVSRSVQERRSESYYHNDYVRGMVGVLRRLGWRVYPGGVGIAGVYAMADLLAIDGDDFLFVECLSKTSVQKFSAHLKKRELAMRVPFCFVGPVPDDFMATLPATAYGIAHPASPAMLNGEWVPHFWRTDREFVPRFIGVVTKGRSLAHVRITLDGLRLEEDVSSFLWTAWTEACIFRRKLYEAQAQAQGWEIRSLRGVAIGHVPFERHGLSGTIIRIKGHGSELALNLGRIPVEAELRGSPAALELLRSWLELVGFPLHMPSSRPRR